MQTAYPGKQIEVANLSAHGFAAYRVKYILDKALKLEPDAVIVWTGNNEFLEDRNYDPPSTGIISLTRHLRTFQWLQSTLSSGNKMSGTELKDVAQFFWKKVHQQSLQLRSDPVQFAQVQEHYRESVGHMVSQSQRYRVPIVLCTVPVNLRDWLPTVSYNRLTGEPHEQWQKLFNQARRCLIEGKYREGIQAMNQANAMENQHAESYFWLGRLLESDGQKTAAWNAYSRARDLDYNPFRANSNFNDTIRVLAKNNEHRDVYLLDLENIFAGATQNAAPGFDLFLDYVHPTKPANLLVARSAFDLLMQDKLLKDKPNGDRFIYHDIPTGTNGVAYRDEDDVSLQITELTMAMENRQYESVVRKTEALAQHVTGQKLTGPDDPKLAHIPLDIAEGYRVFWNYLDVHRRIIMDQPVNQPESERANQRVEEFYDKWFPLGRF